MLKTFLSLATLLLLLPCAPLRAGEGEPFDYFQANRMMVRNGVQAVLMCNGLFTSERSLQQVFDQELAYLERFGGTVGTADGGEYVVEWDTRSVAVGCGDAAA